MAPPKPQFDENVAAARFANLLWRHTGKPEHRHLAELAFRFAASPQIVERRGAFVGALILAGKELDSEPLHVVVVGGKKDPTAQKLIHAALHAPAIYKLVQWYDQNEGPLPGPDQQFPSLPEAAAFLCADGTCSPPVKDITDLTKRLLKAGQGKKSGKRE